MQSSLAEVGQYWDAHARTLEVPGAAWGSERFFSAIKAQHDQVYAYANRVLNLPELEGRSLLELGCGIGLDTVEFARNGAAVMAIDVSPTCIGLTKRFLAYQGLDATVSVADAEHLPFPDERFDVVVARGILMFTPDESRTVSEIFRVLRPAGVVQILLHNRYSWYAALAAASRTNRLHENGDPPVNRLHSIRETKRLLSDFSSVQVCLDRFPTATGRRGRLARLYNSVFTPATAVLPKFLIKPLGYYIILQAIK